MTPTSPEGAPANSSNLAANLEAYAARIALHEPTVRAWAYFDAQLLRTQAATLGARATFTAATRRLFGRPVGIKDIIDVAGMPTGNGIHLPPCHPARDATLVRRLRSAGALIAGKTVTTEFAVGAPGPTRNPYDLRRTPGASSSGSAAAVASGMVPLAVGTQTNGSVIRPAAYCGIIGYKPSAGSIECEGVLEVSPSLDQIGVFADNLADASALAAACGGHDWHGIESSPSPKLGIVRSSVWAAGEVSMQRAFAGLLARLSLTEQAELPPAFDQAINLHQTIMDAEAAAWLGAQIEVDGLGFSAALIALIERGRHISAGQLGDALEQRAVLRRAFAIHMRNFDALVTPAVTGEAPLATSSTGSPVFCTLWTLLGAPTISLPLLSGPNGMPIGVQLVGAIGHDEELLAAAAWLCIRLDRADLVSEHASGALAPGTAKGDTFRFKDP